MFVGKILITSVQSCLMYGSSQIILIKTLQKASIRLQMRIMPLRKNLSRFSATTLTDIEGFQLLIDKQHSFNGVRLHY